MVPNSLYMGAISPSIESKSIYQREREREREMGICASTPSQGIHDDAYGQENGVYFSGITENESQRIGSIHSHAGSKGLNQDCAILYQGYGIEEGALCAVFDGHGKNGHVVSKIVRNRLPSLLLSQRNSIAKIGLSPKIESGQSKSFLQWKDACVTAFKAVDKELKFLPSLDCSCSGTTASVVVRQGEDLIIANLGDSRAVLGTRNEKGEITAVQLTTDFKPGVPSEAERIRKCKGRVLALKEEPHIQRVWLPHEDSPGLAMSRSFGDFVLKNNGIICTPEVSYHRLAPDDAFLVVASDGVSRLQTLFPTEPHFVRGSEFCDGDLQVWDVLSNEEVISIVAEHADSEKGAAEAVVDAATASWKDKFPNSKRDDCTAICLFLHSD